jgi:hypothetical protein
VILVSDGLESQDGWSIFHNANLNVPCIPGEPGCFGSGGGVFSIIPSGMSGNAFEVGISGSSNWEAFGVTKGLSPGVDLLPSRRYRVSWYWQDAAGACIYSGVFIGGSTVPALTPTQQTQNLIAVVISLNLSQGASNAFDAKLGAAIATLDAARANAATTAGNQICAFVNQVNADLSAGKLTADQANQLITSAQSIRVSLGLTGTCP